LGEKTQPSFIAAAVKNKSNPQTNETGCFMLHFSQQDKNEAIRLVLHYIVPALALFIMTTFLVAKGLSIQFDSARHMLAGAVVSVAFIALLNEEAIHFWRISIGFCLSVILVGSFSAAQELYVQHFTLLGMGELPQWFNVVYALIVCLAMLATAYFVKRDLLG
jgi:hypothetical protein